MTTLIFIEALIATVGPFILGWYFSKRLKVSWRVFLIGAVTFIISQVVHIPLVIPFNRAFAKGAFGVFVFCLGIGLMAGLCEEVARYLKLKPQTIYTWAQQGKIPAAKIGKEWRFKKSMIDRWFLSHFDKKFQALAEGGQGDSED